MRALARRTGNRRHEVAIRDHSVVVDEPADLAGTDEGPTPLELLAASLASCMAVTMELYADRKGWDLGEVAVAVEYDTANSGEPTHFHVAIHIPGELDDDQLQRVLAIGARCPVHRALEGDVAFTQQVERTPLPAA